MAQRQILNRGSVAFWRGVHNTRLREVVERLLKDVSAESESSTAELRRVSWAQKVTLGVGDVLARCVVGVAAVEAQLVAAPTLSAVFNTCPLELAALLQTRLNGHFFSVVVDLVSQQSTVAGL